MASALRKAFQAKDERGALTALRARVDRFLRMYKPTTTYAWDFVNTIADGFIRKEFGHSEDYQDEDDTEHDAFCSLFLYLRSDRYGKAYTAFLHFSLKPNPKKLPHIVLLEGRFYWLSEKEMKAFRVLYEMALSQKFIVCVTRYAAWDLYDSRALTRIRTHGPTL